MLSAKIMSKCAHVSVVGLGYVGLPLALLCSEAGYRVMGIDSDEGKIQQIAAGRSPASNVSHKDIQDALQDGRFDPASDHSEMCSADLVIFCLPTPLTRDSRPDYSNIFEVVDYLASCCMSEQLIILESTVNPQFTRQALLPRLTDGRGKVGADFYLGYSPERVDPGRQSMSLKDVTKIVSGITRDCLELTQLFYRQLGVPTTSVSCPEVAEAAKILENTHRDVNIALVNEMARILSEANIDMREVIDTASTKEYGFSPYYPSHGVGGHCVPVDSVLYSRWARSQKTPARLAEMARNINDSMPEFAEKRIVEVLQSFDVDTSSPSVGVFFLGVTYKKDVDDIRKSPTVQLMNNLVARGWEVGFYDPMVKELHLDGVYVKSHELGGEALRETDCVVLAVNHSCFEPEWIVNNCSLILDMTGAMRPHGAEHIRDLFG